MTREEFIDNCKYRLTDYIESITERSRGNKENYICPLCKSGDGRKGTGGLSIQKNGIKFKCFACDVSGDIFDLIAVVEGIEPGTRDLFKRAEELFNISATGTAQVPVKKERKEQHIMEETQTIDYTKYIAQHAVAAQGSSYAKEYLQNKRGLSVETIKRFNIGFDPNFSFISSTGREVNNLGHAIIIPSSPNGNHFIARLINPPTWFSNVYVKPSGMLDRPFNIKALYSESTAPIFVTEGQFDALSIIEAGADAIAINSTSNKSKLASLLKDKPSKRTLILSFDTDEPGVKSQKALQAEFDNYGISYVLGNVCGDCKDPNEYLMKDKSAFIKAVQSAVDMAADTTVDRQEAVQSDRERYHNETNAKAYLPSFLADVQAGRGEKPIHTHLPILDQKLGGGLFAGLYVLGAVPSIGKTTFVVNLMDNIAKLGKQDVLYFSLEMAKRELIAKSVSREYALLAEQKKWETKRISTRAILSCFDSVNRNIEGVVQAFNAYDEYAEYISILEGIGSIGAREIFDTIKMHMEFRGTRPVIIIDYLQLLAPYDSRQTDKQNMDTSIMELKRISRDLSIPIIAVSSFSRAAYTNEASMSSVKESGGIEFSCDCLLGLQYKSMSGIDGEKNKNDANKAIKMAMSEEKREIELLILKNRNGVGSACISYTFDTVMSAFYEGTAQDIKPSNFPSRK